MDNQKFNQILKSSPLKNMVVSGSTGTKVFVSYDSDNNNYIQRSPSLLDLKRKYISGDDRKETDNLSLNLDTQQDDEEDDVDMKIVKEESSDTDSNNQLKERTVIVSVKEGVIGSRG